jgi:hypothetical protein
METTGNAADETPATDPRTTILVRINNPPMNAVYDVDSPPTGGVTIPEGAKAGDPVKLEWITDKTFSIAVDGADNDFIALGTFFVDPDSEDSITGGDHICHASTSPAGQGFGTVAFNTDATNIQVSAKKPGMFDLIVTCTDTLGEMLTDRVEVTIIQ